MSSAISAMFEMMEMFNAVNSFRQALQPAQPAYSSYEPAQATYSYYQQPTYSPYQPICVIDDDENKKLKKKVEKQQERIDRLEATVAQQSIALAQVAVATAQTANAIAMQANHASSQAKLPAASASEHHGFSKNQVCTGRVNKLCAKGANVTIGNYFGYLPYSEVADANLEANKNALKIGKEVRVKAIGFKRYKGNQNDLIILSMKQVGTNEKRKQVKKQKKR